MCGIIAVLNTVNGPDRLRPIVLERARRIRHRGPTWSGLWKGKNAILAHERLAIVDLNNGSQPIVNVEGNIALAVNGEIYNHYEVRKDLREPAQFVTESDSEIILHQYEQNGASAKSLRELNGIFAFVLVDDRDQSFFIGRDALGVIPLYWGRDAEDQIWVASELKGLHDVCVSFEDFPPGYMYSSERGILERWYTPKWLIENHLPSTPCDLSILRAKFTAAVRRQLMSDVPYGVLLSGGLDSSLIASLVARLTLHPNNEILPTGQISCPQLTSFCVGLANSPDLAMAKRVAQYLGTTHHEFIFTIEEGLNAISDAIYHLETYDVTTIRAATPMYLMSRKIRTLDIKVVLSGEGSDEIFGGYLYFHKCPNHRAMQEELVRKLKMLYKFDCLMDDHQILTAKGWLFVDEMLALEQAGQVPLVASYNERLKKIQYQPVRGPILVKDCESRAMVELKHRAWRVESNEYGEPATLSSVVNSNHVSLCVTADHTMLLRQGHRRTTRTGDTTCSWTHEDGGEYTRVKARTAVSQDAKDVVKLLAHAPEGAEISEDAENKLADHLRMSLELYSKDEIEAFLELYGYWLGDGSIQRVVTARCAVGGSVYAGIRFAPVKKKDIVYLDALLARLHLCQGVDYWKSSSLTCCGEKVYIIYKTSWASYFEIEYGSKYLAGTASEADEEDEVTTTAVEVIIRIKSAKWFFSWVLISLNKYQMRLLLRGLRMANGSSTRVNGDIVTSSVVFRDSLITACLHAGYSSYFTLLYRAGTDRGIVRGRHIIARHDAWSVHYSDAPLANTPILYCARDIRAREIECRVWCVDVPNNHLIITRRAVATTRADGIKVVTKASKAIIVGNCLRANKATAAWGIEARVPFLDLDFLDYAMSIDPTDKMCGSPQEGQKKIEKFIIRKAFEDYLPNDILWRQKEQFSDGVGYSWIDSIKAEAEKVVSDREYANATHRFPYNTPTTKEAYFIRTIFECHFPQQSAREAVPGGPSVACSTPAAILWDQSFRKYADCSGRSILGVHENALTEEARAEVAGAAIPEHLLTKHLSLINGKSGQ